MDSLLFAAPVPGPVAFGTLGWVGVVALAAAIAPLWLVARQALSRSAAKTARAPRQVIEGDVDLSQRAA